MEDRLFPAPETWWSGPTCNPKVPYLWLPERSRLSREQSVSSPDHQCWAKVRTGALAVIHCVTDRVWAFYHGVTVGGWVPCDVIPQTWPHFL